VSESKPEKNGNGRVTGKVTARGGVEYIGEKRHPKTYLIVECKDEKDEKFNRSVAVTFFGKNVEKAEGVQTGDSVTAFFAFKSRSYTDRNGVERWSTDLDGWKVDMVRAAPRNAPPPEPNGGGWGGSPPAGPDDDIPFSDCSLTAEPSAIAPVLRRLT
jgi:hypothetical protein